MVSLNQLRAQFPTILVIDAASTRIQVGLLSSGKADTWKSQTTEAGTGIFAAVGTDAHNRDHLWPNAADAFVFCEGPGSVLGIRTAAIALRVWRMLRPRPVFAYTSLNLVANFQLQAGIPTPFSVVADARRETWHCLEVQSAERIGPLRRGNPDTFPAPLFTPLEFRHWAALPAGTQKITYDAEQLFAATGDLPLLRPSPEPDAFLHEEPAYLAWKPQIHRAPS